MDIQKKQSEKGGQCTYMNVSTVIVADIVVPCPSFDDGSGTEYNFLSSLP
jgi:hypothetical protein